MRRYGQYGQTSHHGQRMSGPPPQMIRGPPPTGGGPPRMLGPPPVGARLGMPPPGVFLQVVQLESREKLLAFCDVVGISTTIAVFAAMARQAPFLDDFLMLGSQGRACYQMTRSLDQISAYSNVGNLQYFNVANQVREAPEFGIAAVESSELQQLLDRAKHDPDELIFSSFVSFE
ncbi:hypothetical protein Tco_1149498 [Tanacetum coccineum]